MNSIWKIMDCLKQKKSNLCYIDLFCGAGGTSTGIEQTRINNNEVASVIACVNHDKNAIASHSENHPNALHFIEDIRTLNLQPIVQLVSKIRSMNPEAIIVLWASLECTNFSKAKGGLARDPDSRTLAEHLYRYVAQIQPDYIQIENVEEFMSWGDLDDNGKPISRDKGKSFERWIRNIKYGYGLHPDQMIEGNYDEWFEHEFESDRLEMVYDYDHRILNSADFGAYTARKRFFGVFAKKGLNISFPEPTHAKNPKPGESLIKWKAVKDVLDFTDEGKSIFDRKKALVDKTLERIYAGLVSFVAGGKKDFEEHKTQISFLSKYFSGHPKSKNISVEGPAHTIKCIDNHSLVTADFLQAYYGTGDNVSSIEVPAPTLTTKDRLALITSHFFDMQYGKSRGASVYDPAGTVTANPKHSLISATKIGGRFLMNPQYNSPGGSIDKPCFTLIARMDKMPPYLIDCVSPDQITEKIPSFIQINGDQVIYHIFETDTEIMIKIKEFMALYGIIDIKMRMLKIPELKQIMGFPKNYTLVGTQAQQKKYIGNAVEVSIASALCRALYLANFSDKQRKTA